ncbi:MAG TPA: PduL/EutD family phosphate acyltransferase [bacterium]|nr:PduL/EutD family phosphate acyltransferase [bacterium]
MKKIKIPVEVSARHIHLSQRDLDKLFGKNYILHKLKDLSQVGDFAAKEKVELVKPNNCMNSLRIVGPARAESQIELSFTDAVHLGIDAPTTLSGKLENVKAFLDVKGSLGKVKVKVIVPERHLHCSLEEAKKYNLKDGQKVSVEIIGQRGLVFNNIIVRTGVDFKMSCHLDTDEANACGLNKVCGIGTLIL